jgi:hypothetical protein
LELSTKDSDCLLFPTLTSNECYTSRPAGQTKCERWFKDKGLIAPGYQLGRRAIALAMGFPSDWFEVLSQPNSNQTTISSLPTPQDASEPDISQDEPLPQDKQPLPSEESSISTQLLGGDEKLLKLKEKYSPENKEISISCLILPEGRLVEQPKQPEVKGVIKQDLGDRFLVEVNNEIISVSKLFVYPDFSKSVGQIEKIPPSKKVSPPSKIPPTKTRRKKGDGTGYIYHRTITRRGKQYQEFYYRYRDGAYKPSNSIRGTAPHESGKLKAKYIPTRLLDRVQEAESRKKPIADILVLLGGDEISRGEQFGTSDDESVQTGDLDNELITTSRGEQITPPSTKKRKQGYGAGYIECKPIKRSGKEYKQYWYHYEFWQEGDRITKKSKYIPNHQRSQIEKLESEKVPVEEILNVLKNKGRKK